MKHLIFILTAVLYIITFEVIAQDKEPPYIEGIVKINRTKKPAQNIEVRITKAKLFPDSKMVESEEEFALLKTDKKGVYRSNIEYGFIFVVYIKKEGYTSGYYIVDATLTPSNAKVPELENGAGQESFLYEYSEFQELELPLDTAYYQKFPNDYIKFSVQKDEFIGDENHRRLFMSKTYKDTAWEKEQKRLAAAKKAEEERLKAAKEQKRKNKKYAISAKLVLKGNTALSKVKVLLFKEDPALNPAVQPIESAVTNAFGKFTFTELKEDENYFLGIEGIDESIAPNIKVNNKHGNVVLAQTPPTVVSLTNGKFGIIGFTATKDFFNNFEVIGKTILVAGNLLLGDKDKLPLQDVKLLLKDATDKIVQTTRTNALGGFAFSNVDPNQKYKIDVEHNMPSQIANKRVSILNKAGQEVYSSVADANGKFKFEILAEDKFQLQLLESDDTELNISLKGKIYTNLKEKTPLKNSKVYLSSQSGKLLVNASTDENGNFSFENISADIAYLINLDENDPKLKTVTKVYLENEDGTWVREITKDNLNKFTFQLLSLEVNRLNHIEIIDTWLDIIKNKSAASLIAEPIYFKAGEDRILDEAASILNKVLVIMKAKPSLKIEVGSHTDATGSDIFNMELSKKRAKAAVDYLVSKGANPNNLIGIGYGETKLKNNCGNNVKCSEAEHSQNRRIEFKILSK
jgi:outer membrane protein OmpA-like peptidoglycan-associated protein